MYVYVVWGVGLKADIDTARLAIRSLSIRYEISVLLVQLAE